MPVISVHFYDSYIRSEVHIEVQAVILKVQ